MPTPPAPRSRSLVGEGLPPLISKPQFRSLNHLVQDGLKRHATPPAGASPACPVCRKEYATLPALVIAETRTCGTAHFMHLACLLNWLQVHKKTTCPVNGCGTELLLVNPFATPQEQEQLHQHLRQLMNRQRRDLIQVGGITPRLVEVTYVTESLVPAMKFMRGYFEQRGGLLDGARRRYMFQFVDSQLLKDFYHNMLLKYFLHVMTAGRREVRQDIWNQWMRAAWVGLNDVN